MDVITTGSDLSGAAILIPIITGIVQALKMVGLKDKYAPVAALAIGAGLGVLLRQDAETFTSAVFSGLIYGLSASGLYSGLVHTLGLAKAATVTNSPYDNMNIPTTGATPLTTTMNQDGSRPTATIIDGGASVTKVGDVTTIETEKKE